MRRIRQINIKNRTYYFYKDQINLKGFDASLLKVDKAANCNNINSVKHDWSLWRKKGGNKYLVLDDVNENKEVLQKYE